MKIRTATAWCAVTAAGVCFTAPAVAQYNEKHETRSQQPAKQPTLDEMMAEMMKYAEPGEHHRLLQPTIGAFHVVGKMWSDPSQSEPEMMEGDATNEWILGGRFVQTHYMSQFMGMPFEGLGMLGYDRYLQQYQSFWWDTFGTMTYQSTGTVTPDGKVFTYHGAMQDPSIGGALVHTRDIIRVIDNNKHIMEMHRQMPDGTWFKVMEMTYTRK